ncbi:MAG: glycosyltransferase [Actinomycetota bacterium]|nr:glycosyltransferase [Actinomycetota bacterium]
MRIVQLANFHAPTSGGLRTMVDRLAAGYRRAGHSVVQILPGPRDRTVVGPWGLRIELAAPRVHACYRLVTRPSRVWNLVRTLEPDVVELNDRTTMVPVAHRAHAAGIPVVLISHERIEGMLEGRLPAAGVRRALADRWNRSLGASLDVVVCPSAYGGVEWRRVGAEVEVVPWGVDLDDLHPPAHPVETPADQIRLVHLGRFSAEKRTPLVPAAAAELSARGWRVHLTMVGDGPLRSRLPSPAGVDVAYEGFVTDRTRLARLLGAADVGIQPCPVETFGLSILETLACGTPVVVSDRGAATALAAPGAIIGAASDPGAIADAAEDLRRRDRGAARLASRRRAAEFDADGAVERMLAIHGGFDGRRSALAS